MAATTTIALLAFVAVAAVAGEVCVDKSKGLLVGIKHDIQVHILPAGQHSYEITLPSPCGFLTNGVKVHVCDPDAPPAPPPLVNLPSLYLATVYRHASWRPATLTATVYCLIGRSGIDVQDQPKPAGDYQAWPQ